MKIYFLRKYRRAITVFVIALILDFAARFFYEFQMVKVFKVEAILFIVSGIVLLGLSKKDKTANKKAARFDFWFAIFFIIGGLRPAIFLGGAPIYTANMITLVVGVIIFILIYLLSKSEKK